MMVTSARQRPYYSATFVPIHGNWAPLLQDDSAPIVEDALSPAKSRMSHPAQQRWFQTIVVWLLVFSISTYAWTQEGSIQDAAKLSTQAEQLYKQGRYKDAIPLAQRALEIQQQSLGPYHPNTAASLNALAQLYQATGAYAQAEPLYQRALAIREKALGANHPDTATSLNDLGAYYHTIGAYAMAEPLFQRALESAKRRWGPSTRATIRSHLKNGRTRL